MRGALSAECRDLAANYIALARKLCRVSARSYPSRYWDEFESRAMFALVEAASTYRPAMGSFCNHAFRKIRWALHDAQAQIIRLAAAEVIFAECPPTRDEPAVRDEPSEWEGEEAFEKLLSKVPRPHADVFRLVFRDGLGQAEAAKALGKSYGHVNKHYRWGLEYLRHALRLD